MKTVRQLFYLMSLIHLTAMIAWAGPEKNTVQYSEDGINFEVMAALEDIPPAGGAYIQDKFDDNGDGKGFTWGLCHYGRTDWNFLLRFDCDLQRESRKQLDWSNFKYYSMVREVIFDPEKFNVPREALR